MQLRDYQQKLIKDIYSLFRQGKRRCLAFAPTGAGKSIIICKLISDAISKNRRVLVVVHRKKLASQLAESVAKFCKVESSIIAPGFKPDYNNPVQIAMAQTLSRRELPDNIGLLIGDEIHQTGFFKIWEDCLNYYCGSIWSLNTKAFVIGLTATPWRTQRNEGFCRLFDCKALAPSPRELVNRGYLTFPRLFTYSLIESSLLKVDSTGDFSKESLAKACNPHYNNDVVTKWLEKFSSKKTIFFAANCNQANSLLSILTEKGFTTELITGMSSEKIRETTFNNFKLGSTQCLINVGVLVEGYDETSIECVVIARPTRSKALLTQMIGRGLRLHEGKSEVYLVDCGECFDWLIKQGHEDVINLSEVTLCPKFRTKQPTSKKQCKHCGEALPLYASFCPHCLTEVSSKGRKRRKTFAIFPELEEILTNETRQQCVWLRHHIIECHKSDINPETIFRDFHARYNYLPPKDYFKGVLFGGESCNKFRANYREYLAKFNLNESLVEFLINLEFGVQ